MLCGKCPVRGIVQIDFDSIPLSCEQAITYHPSPGSETSRSLFTNGSCGNSRSHILIIKFSKWSNESLAADLHRKKFRYPSREALSRFTG